MVMFEQRTLLIMSCGGQKNESGEWLPASSRYTGPLWQTLRTSCHLKPDTGIAVLSARYGLIQGSTMTQNYNARLTPALAAKMIEEGSDGLWPKAPPGVPQISYGNRACAEMASLSRHGDAPFDTIVMCGGRLYIDVMRALVHDIMQKTDAFSFDAEIIEINGPIGKMRQKLAATFPPQDTSVQTDPEPDAEEEDLRPWERDPAIRSQLTNAGLRYAAMVGVIDADAADGQAVMEEDRRRHPSFLRHDDDGKLNPLFRDADAEAFVSEITGQNVKVCRGWLRHDWPLS